MEPRAPGPAGGLQDIPAPIVQIAVVLVAIVGIIVAPRPAAPGVPAAAAAEQAPDTWDSREAAAAEAAATRPGSVSFAVIDGSGTEVASLNDENRVSAASTIKAMILVAYLRQPEVADRDLTDRERASMERMITASSNTDASRLLNATGWASMRELAQDAGIADEFTPDTDQWGLSEITAGALASFFHQLPQLVPVRHREFALDLFAGVIPAQQWGMPEATPDDWQWHIKAGWITSVVNQVGAFTRGGEEFTVAMTIEGRPGTGVGIDIDAQETDAMITLRTVTGALFGDGDLPGAGDPVPCDAAVVVPGGAEAVADTAATAHWASQADSCAPSLAADGGDADPRD